MRAADLLGDRDTPALRARLRPVDPGMVPVRAVPIRLLALWPRWVAALALPGSILVRPDVVRGDPARLAALICHELVHVRQWRTMGVVRFLWRYAGSYLLGRRRGLGHRESYRQIDQEVEARAIETMV
jgi:hypothetical protein